MAAWNKKGIDAARQSRSNPCTDTKRAETCAAPRHVDAPRDVYFIFSFKERAAWGGRGWRCQTMPFYFILFPCSADHELD